MNTATITEGEPLAEAQAAKYLEQFHRDGFAIVPGVLSADEVRLIREITDRFIDDPELESTRFVEKVFTASVLRYTQSLHRVFVDMLVKEPIISLAEAIVGKNCAFCGQNVIRSGKNQAISHWHVDDIVEFPLPDDVPRHDARVKMPVFWFSVQIALSDIDSIEDGPTQIVPTSHYSGRRPPKDTDWPVFEGHEPVPMLCKAGDIYLFNHQTWHRGAPNTSGRMRYLMQNQYNSRWASTRFDLRENDCNLPDDQLVGVSERALKILGKQLTTPADRYAQ